MKTTTFLQNFMNFTAKTIEFCLVVYFMVLKKHNAERIKLGNTFLGKQNFITQSLKSCVRRESSHQFEVVADNYGVHALRRGTRPGRRSFDACAENVLLYNRGGKIGDLCSGGWGCNGRVCIVLTRHAARLKNTTHECFSV